jgi:gamma-resorcylate decarboxylase
VDRVLFSVDYPYEEMDVAARWIDDILLDNATKLKIGRTNAERRNYSPLCGSMTRV